MSSIYPFIVHTRQSINLPPRYPADPSLDKSLFLVVFARRETPADLTSRYFERRALYRSSNTVNYTFQELNLK